MPVNKPITSLVLEEIVEEILTGSFLLNNPTQYVPIKDIDKLTQKQAYPFTTAISNVVTFNRDTETANLVITTVFHKPKKQVMELDVITQMRLPYAVRPYVMAHMEVVDWIIGRKKPAGAKIGKWDFDMIGDAQTNFFYSSTDPENKEVKGGSVNDGDYITVLTSVSFQGTRGTFCCSLFDVTDGD